MPPSAISPQHAQLSMAMLLAAWACVWAIRPTQTWKRSWHAAEDRANATFIGDYGLTVVIYCLPVLAVAAMSYICLHLATGQKEENNNARKKRRSWMSSLTNPAIAMSNPVGIVSAAELLTAALFVVFLSWTYYSNVSGDFKKMTPYKSLQLNRWQLKMMHMGVRIGSLSEACLVILLLPVLRGMAVFRVLGVEFEASVRYHIWVGNGMLLLSLLHGTGIMFVWTLKGSLFKEIIKWPSTGRVNIAGALGLATGAVIWVTSLPQMRRKQFQLFYSVHHLYILFFLFFLIHAGDRHFYLVFAGVLLFALDKVLRALQSGRSTLLVSASILPCKAVKLTLPKHSCMRYTPTSIVFIKVPSISNFQWHPFTITSTSNMDTSEFSLLAKCHGRWTTDLHNLLDSAGPADRIPVAVEGPYGQTTVTYRRYKSIVLIAGGSGISPFLSILQDIASRNNEIINTNPTKILLIYAVKKTQDLSMLALISRLLLSNNQSASRELGDLQLKLFVTQEQEEEEAAVGQPPVTAEKLLQDLSSQVKSITFNDKGRGALPAPPEGLLWRAAITALSFIVFLASLIVLSHAFLHQEKSSSSSAKKRKSKEMKESPSWIGDLFVVCSLAAAASCCAAAAVVVSRWGRGRNNSMGEGEGLKHKNDENCAGMEDANMLGVLPGKHEVNFGKRPDLTEMLAEIANDSKEESEVGVFVCGPTSMQKSVASFFTRRKKAREDCAGKHKCSLKAHFISFSL